MNPRDPRKPRSGHSDPVHELLGVSRVSGPRAILGLGDGGIDSDILDASLRTRLRAIHGQADQFEVATIQEACRVVEAAASALRSSTSPSRSSRSSLPPLRPADGSDQVPVTPPKPVGPIASRVKSREAELDTPEPLRANRRPAPVKPTPRVTEAHLTPFDRLVLSVLVAGGGWNSRTRGIIAGMAAQVGLDAPTLRRVVEGLAGFMRDRGSEGTIGETAMVPAPIMRNPSRVESAVLRVSDGITREFRGDSAASRLRLTILFASLAIFFGAVLIIVLTAPSPGVRDIETRRLAAEEAIANREAEAILGGSGAEIDGTYRATPSLREGVTLPAKFPRPPMFRGDGRPDASVFRLERMPAMMDEALQMALQLELDPAKLSERRASAWLDVVATGAETWPLMPADDRLRMVTAILEVFGHAEDDAVAGRLLAAFEVEPSAPLRTPIDVWVRSFKAGMLGLMVATPALPESVRGPARQMIDESLAGSSGRNVQGGPFAALAGRALDRMASPLVEMIGVSEESLVKDCWERWFDANRILRRDAGLQSSVLIALETLLQHARSLAVQGIASDVLGRLLYEVDWTAAGPDPEGLRATYSRWMLDQGIPATNLWVLASLLDGTGRAGWFRPEFVPDPEEGMSDRRRVQKLADAAWPESVGPLARGDFIPIEPQTLEEFDARLVDVAELVDLANSPVQRLAALVAAERLATAAALLALERRSDADAAIGDVLDQVMTGNVGVDLDPLPRPRQMANDGQWSQAWREAGSDQQLRRDLIAALRRNSIAGDLGPKDAEIFVNQVWRGPTQIRNDARAAALEIFGRGAVVAVELLDTADRASRNESTLAFIEAFTGVPMPNARSEDAEARIRAALAMHALSLLDLERNFVDQLAEVVGVIVRTRAEARLPVEPMSGRREPEDLAAMAADGVRRAATALFLASPPSVTLEEIDRRRIARRGLVANGIQGLVAEHVAELEFLGFLIAAEVPSKRSEVRELLLEAAIARSVAPGGLEQAALEALAIARMERLRFVPRDTDPLGASG
jgi:hypothetical protein